MERITLYEKLRLIERSESEVNGVWKGAHLLLLFLAFVFGSFCTFCFHLLMYLFDEKCVLFPKLLTISSLRKNIINEFFPDDQDAADMLPVDFLSTQWVEKSACLLPTYVPLVSGIFGLVWTTMFLMCSTGSGVLTGLQRPWRILPPVFVFSLAMGGLCAYTSFVTHYGLLELCHKLSEITGSKTCTYTVNVATLAYERRIRGVYQATRLTIYSAWLHTACWLLSALLALIRVLFAVDFKLVKVTVLLQGNIDRMLERHERHIRTISPDVEGRMSDSKYSSSTVRIHFKKKEFHAKYDSSRDLSAGEKTGMEQSDDGGLLYYSEFKNDQSEDALLQSEQIKLNKLKTIASVSSEHRFIVKMLYKMLDSVAPKSFHLVSDVSIESEITSENIRPIIRQYGQQKLHSLPSFQPENSQRDASQAQETGLKVDSQVDLGQNSSSEILSYDINEPEFKSTYNLTSEMKLTLDKNVETKSSIEKTEPNTSKAKKTTILKSNLKRIGVQTDDSTKEKSFNVHIDPNTSVITLKTSEDSLDVIKEDKNTQTVKEKQE